MHTTRHSKYLKRGGRGGYHWNTTNSSISRTYIRACDVYSNLEWRYYTIEREPNVFSAYSALNSLPKVKKQIFPVVFRNVIGTLQYHHLYHTTKYKVNLEQDYGNLKIGLLPKKKKLPPFRKKKMTPLLKYVCVGVIIFFERRNYGIWNANYAKQKCMVQRGALIVTYSLIKYQPDEEKEM